MFCLDFKQVESQILYVLRWALNLIKSNYDEFKLSTSVCSIQVNCYTITVLHMILY